MKKLFYLLFYIILSVFILSGCNISNSNKNTIWKLEDNERFTYNPFIQCFIKYDLDESQNKLLIPYTESDIIQYSFNTPSKIFTSGHSFENNFTIIENKDGHIQELYKLEDDNLAIFPLATDGENIFFIKTDYSNENEINSSIVKYDDNKIYEYTKTHGLISYGALMKNLLYYTVYEPSTDSYTLYCLDISDYDNSPEIIKNNLISGEILFLNNQLYCSNQEMFFNENDSFKKRSINLSDNKSNKLIQINPSSGNDWLELIVIDKQTNEIIYNNNNVIAIDFFDEILKVYSPTTIHNVDLYKNNK
ncbi:MAG: hypothetical protein E7K67_01985 [Peptostreptococcaceae bacterium]|nr:hypothetical protein [Serratia marcescens]MDU7535745.1 hypothetical protein [Peptostreptococcaceae bacterium]